ncbi:hypothetical protein BGX26_008549, partial [Mortierella sp. AD094]
MTRASRIEAQIYEDQEEHLEEQLAPTHHTLQQGHLERYPEGQYEYEEEGDEAIDKENQPIRHQETVSMSHQHRAHLQQQYQYRQHFPQQQEQHPGDMSGIELVQDSASDTEEIPQQHQYQDSHRRRSEDSGTVFYEGQDEHDLENVSDQENVQPSRHAAVEAVSQAPTQALDARQQLLYRNKQASQQQ